MNILKKIDEYLNERIDEVLVDNAQEHIDDHLFGAEFDDVAYRPTYRTRREIWKSEFNTWQLKYKQKNDAWELWFNIHRDGLKSFALGLSFIIILYYIAH
jgi:hypothetical protein